MTFRRGYELPKSSLTLPDILHKYVSFFNAFILIFTNLSQSILFQKALLIIIYIILMNHHDLVHLDCPINHTLMYIIIGVIIVVIFIFNVYNSVISVFVFLNAIVFDILLLLIISVMVVVVNSIINVLLILRTTPKAGIAFPSSPSKY